MGQEQTQQLLDRKFVFAACVIGAAYVIIIVLVNWIAGKESAGVAAIALTALATAIFKQFETLRFKTLADSEGVTIRVPRLSAVRIALICFALAGGSSIIMSPFMAVVLSLGAPNEFLSALKIGAIDATVKLFLFFLVGYLVPKGWGLLLYSEVAIAAFLAIALGFAPFIVAGQSDSSGVFLAALFCWVYVASAIAGARLGAGPRVPATMSNTRLDPDLSSG